VWLWQGYTNPATQEGDGQPQSVVRGLLEEERGSVDPLQYKPSHRDKEEFVVKTKQRKKVERPDEPLGRDSGQEVFVTVIIEGESPLQMHKYSDDTALSIMSGGASSVRCGERLTPHEEAQRVAYLDGEGNPFLPAENIFQCLVGAGKHIKHGRAKLTNSKTSIIPAIINIEDETCPVQMRGNGAGFVPAQWKEHLSSPTNSTGGKSPSWRPVFYEWYVPFTLKIDTQEIPLSLARTLVDKAGKFQGLGPQRVERKGRFGKFRVCKWEIQG
jgi:hypothetical protein